MRSALRSFIDILHVEITGHPLILKTLNLVLNIPTDLLEVSINCIQELVIIVTWRQMDRVFRD